MGERKDKALRAGAVVLGVGLLFGGVVVGLEGMSSATTTANSATALRTGKDCQQGDQDRKKHRRKGDRTTTQAPTSTTILTGSTTHPMGTTTNPMGTTTNPMSTTTNPMGTTTTNPMGTTTNPMGTTTNPMGTTTNPMGTTTIPGGTTTTNPTDSTTTDPTGTTVQPTNTCDTSTSATVTTTTTTTTASTVTAMPGAPQNCVATFVAGGGRTASGERNDSNAMTAGSGLFPLGSQIRVTNPDTGKSVVVRVNDRSSFCAAMSVAAFEQIRTPGKNLIRNAQVQLVSAGK
ncbi:hypothetical protein GCM10010174_83430 [Kutzneria viridogrisea]|uniref:RlpA-like protein double-psi beta-barrel domain-containing protein n=2 Tax=Kutzneria TaxID=43356 RepID=W5WHL4_9PSEU|nr:septal ring lytic transglycosylase RlpA family protein [Kutzneria albida]AHI00236.1 hypothetical protein KALB_6877 [Kutzneria albida DSM 43870]MBA8925412.1 hypothetical protein [Kutzneria viridogrisea]